MGQIAPMLQYKDLQKKVQAAFRTNVKPIDIKMDFTKSCIYGHISTYGHSVKLYAVSSKTYTKEQLIGCVVETAYDSYDGGSTPLIKESHIIETTPDGMCFSFGTNEYNCAYIYVAYTTNYKPANFSYTLPSIGVYFSYCTNTDVPYVKSLKGTTPVESVTVIENDLLDLENHPVIKEILAKLS